MLALNMDNMETWTFEQMSYAKMLAERRNAHKTSQEYLHKLAKRVLSLLEDHKINQSEKRTLFGLMMEKMADKLVTEIEKSKSVDLQTLLPAFSIPLFGRSASQKLCEKISTLEEISEKSCTEAGIGPKATANLLTWLEEEFYPNEYDTNLPFSFSATKTVKRETIGTVCISGRLNSYPTKARAAEALETHGYSVKNSLTKDCTHLINESGIESAKTQTARERGVIIITDIANLIGE